LLFWGYSSFSAAHIKTSWLYYTTVLIGLSPHPVSIRCLWPGVFQAAPLAAVSRIPLVGALLPGKRTAVDDGSWSLRHVCCIYLCIHESYTSFSWLLVVDIQVIYRIIFSRVKSNCDAGAPTLCCLYQWVAVQFPAVMNCQMGYIVHSKQWWEFHQNQDCVCMRYICLPGSSKKTAILLDVVKSHHRIESRRISNHSHPISWTHWDVLAHWSLKRTMQINAGKKSIKRSSRPLVGTGQSWTRLLRRV